jgi:hypothetical protein
MGGNQILGLAGRPVGYQPRPLGHWVVWDAPDLAELLARAVGQADVVPARLGHAVGAVRADKDIKATQGGCPDAS